jgi:hypothetical protein
MSRNLNLDTDRTTIPLLHLLKQSMETVVIR